MILTNAQSPASGVEALPSPFVSPPERSSLIEVKIMGFSSRPSAIRVPSTSSLSLSEPALMMAPGRMVKTAPECTRTNPCSTYGEPSGVQVVFDVMSSSTVVCAWAEVAGFRKNSMMAPAATTKSGLLIKVGITCQY